MEINTVIKGRIESTRKHEENFYTRITTAAPDPYSRPNIFEIRSKQVLGDDGAVVSCSCTLSGWLGKVYNYTDPNGVPRKGQNCNMALDFVEFLK